MHVIATIWCHPDILRWIGPIQIAEKSTITGRHGASSRTATRRARWDNLGATGRIAGYVGIVGKGIMANIVASRVRRGAIAWHVFHVCLPSDAAGLKQIDQVLRTACGTAARRAIPRGTGWKGSFNETEIIGQARAANIDIALGKAVCAG
jgi:hypothetical protein